MKKLIPMLVFLLIFSSIASASIVVVNDTEEKLYALESVILSGDLEKNELSVSGSGEVISGDKVKVYLFGPTADILISELKLNNKPTSISFDDKGYFFVADKGNFNFNAKMDIRTIGQINLYVPGPMNELKFSILHGYAVDGDQYGLYEQYVIIQRAEEVATLVSGAFKYSFGEKDEFYYSINYQAFGSTLSRQTLYLKNGETVSDVTGALKWEQAGDKLILDLKSKQATVGIRGFFSTDVLRIPLEEDKHHVLIESDPEKKLTVITEAKEVDVSESPMIPQYTNARVFLATGKNDFVITIKKLDLKDSLAATVDSSTNTLAITKEGVVLAEMEYRYQNSGQDYLSVDFTGTPLYAAAAGKPVKLTSEGPEGKLNLAFPKTSPGRTEYFDLVYYTARPKIAVLDLIKLPLAKTNLPITTATTQVYLPKSVFVLGVFGAEGGSQLPSLFSIVVFLLIMCLLSYFLVKDTKFIVLSIIFHAGLYYFNKGLFYISIAIILVLIGSRYFVGYKNKSKALKWILIVAGALVVISIFISGIVMFFMYLPSGGMASQSVDYYAEDDYDYGESYAAEEMVMEAPAPKMAGLLKREVADVQITTTRKGVLPVKLELPRLGNLVTVRHYAILRDEDQPTITLLVAAGWLKYIFYLLALVCGVKAYKMYRRRVGTKK